MHLHENQENNVDKDLTRYVAMLCGGGGGGKVLERKRNRILFLATHLHFIYIHHLALTTFWLAELLSLHDGLLLMTGECAVVTLTG